MIMFHNSMHHKTMQKGAKFVGTLMMRLLKILKRWLVFKHTYSTYYVINISKTHIGQRARPCTYLLGMMIDDQVGEYYTFRFPWADGY